jgi:hypothetical protein
MLGKRKKMQRKKKETKKEDQFVSFSGCVNAMGPGSLIRLPISTASCLSRCHPRRRVLHMLCFVSLQVLRKHVGCCRWLLQCGVLPMPGGVSWQTTLHSEQRVRSVLPFGAGLKLLEHHHWPTKENVNLWAQNTGLRSPPGRRGPRVQMVQYARYRVCMFTCPYREYVHSHRVCTYVQKQLGYVRICIL